MSGDSSLVRFGMRGDLGSESNNSLRVGALMVCFKGSKFGSVSGFSSGESSLVFIVMSLVSGFVNVVKFQEALLPFTVGSGVSVFFVLVGFFPSSLPFQVSGFAGLLVEVFSSQDRSLPFLVGEFVESSVLSLESISSGFGSFESRN